MELPISVQQLSDRHLALCDLCDAHAQADVDARLPEGLQGSVLQIACECGQNGLPALQQCHLQRNKRHQLLPAKKINTK